MPNKIDVSELLGCVNAITESIELLKTTHNNETLTRIFRAAAIKEFEIVLEQTGRLLRQALNHYVDSNTKHLTYKETLRESVKFGLLSSDEARRWFEYRDKRNATAHEYGVNMANELVESLGDFTLDAKTILMRLNEKNYD